MLARLARLADKRRFTAIGSMEVLSRKRFVKRLTAVRDCPNFTSVTLVWTALLPIRPLTVPGFPKYIKYK